MRLLVETTGPFQLLDHDGRKLIRFTGQTVVTNTSFVQSRAAAGQIHIVTQVGDAATDEEWLAFAAECKDDLELAVASFVSKYPVTPLPPSVDAETLPPTLPTPPKKPEAPLKRK